jgi:hypothetical protein
MSKPLPKSALAEAGAGDKVTLIDHATGKQLDLPVLGGTEGPKVIDIRSPYR